MDGILQKPETPNDASSNTNWEAFKIEWGVERTGCQILIMPQMQRTKGGRALPSNTRLYLVHLSSSCSVPSWDRPYLRICWGSVLWHTKPEHPRSQAWRMRYMHAHSHTKCMQRLGFFHTAFTPSALQPSRIFTQPFKWHYHNAFREFPCSSLLLTLQCLITQSKSLSSISLAVQYCWLQHTLKQKAQLWRSTFETLNWEADRLVVQLRITHVSKTRTFSDQFPLF